MLAGAGAQTVANFATNIEDGDPEVTQGLSFTVTSDNAALFTTGGQPKINIDGTTGTLTYTPSGTAGTAEVSVTLTDDAQAGGAALTSGVEKFTITVVRPNSAPSLAAIGVSGTEGKPVVFALANFTGAYSDPESDPLASITVATLPASGKLKLSTVDVTAGQVIPAANLGNLSYEPVAKENGTKSFTVSASDGALSSGVPTVSIMLSPVNDAPSFVLPTVRNLNVLAGNGVKHSDL